VSLEHIRRISNILPPYNVKQIFAQYIFPNSEKYSSIDILKINPDLIICIKMRAAIYGCPQIVQAGSKMSYFML